MRGLKICTLRFAICARRSRRISSSLLPLNMLPVMTSIHPAFGRAWVMSMPYSAVLRAREVLAALGADADCVAGVDKRRDVDDQAGFGGRGFDLVAGSRPLDARDGVDDLEVHRHRELDADGRFVVELHRDHRIRLDVVDGVA